MEQIVIIIHVIVAIILIGLVLVQHGKGADIGAAFGSGASNTMFGSQGAMSFLMKVTATLAAIFFATNLTMGYLVGHHAKSVEGLTSSPAVTAPSSKGASSTPQKQQFVFPSAKKSSPQGSGIKKTSKEK